MSNPSGLQVDPALRAFVEDELVPGVGLTPDWFWATLAALHERFAPRAASLLERRDELQAQIDAWHREHGAAPEGDLDEYVRFLTAIGYLEPLAEPHLSVTGVDREIAEVPGPQLVVPATVARYALNAANARWGSLFDALYGTDALPLDHELASGLDERRAAQVIAEADRLLDTYFPLERGSHADTSAYRVEEGRLVAETDTGRVGLAEPAQFAGYRGDPGAPTAVLLRRHGLHAELTVDAGHRVGRGAPRARRGRAAGVGGHHDRRPRGLGGHRRRPGQGGRIPHMAGSDDGRADRHLPEGRPRRHPVRRGRPHLHRSGRRRAGAAGAGAAARAQRRPPHAAVRRAHRRRPSRCWRRRWTCSSPRSRRCYDLRGIGRFRNSRAGSLYVVKPKMHGPDEVSLSADLFTAVEQALELPPTTIKMGIMDEERRTSVNLEACIARAADRVIFVNTGFLDRTGDEIHTDFEAGPVVRKDDEKSTVWLQAYEDRNVDVALRAGFAGQAQIGKGMWAQPAGMRAMLDTKGAHPRAGANTAWVPSPTAATLHALHYLETDVVAVQRELADRPLTDREKLLVVPVLPDGGAGLGDDERRRELETNAQSILGYVVRWVGLGIGCSTVPDLDGVGLMEDRATLRISSQEIANWLHHGLVDEAQVRETFARMAVLVDEQNAGEPGYVPMSKDLEHSPSFRAALDLVFSGREEPNGYTERALTVWRQRAKGGGNGGPDGGGDGTRAAVLADEAPSPS